jgi:hypothetical protein
VSLDINRQELIKQLRLAFGFRGQTSFQLGESVLPVVNLYDLEGPPFHSKQGGVSSGALGAVAAQYSSFYLAFPTSGVPDAARGVLRRLALAGGAGIGPAVQIGVLPLQAVAGYTDLGVPGPWDSFPNPTTLTDRNRSMAHVFTLNDPTQRIAASSSFYVVLPLNGSIVLDLPWELKPGNCIMVQGATVNQALSAAFYWDEYNVG